VEYTFVRRIGRGGMGTVDLAHAPDGTEVALKRLSLHGTPEELERARVRIRREADVLEQLRHPHVVHLREVLDDGDDVVLVMDHLAGGTLAQRVAAHGPLAPEQVDRLADQLLDALATAHRLGIVHRDIKPGNVLFDEAGEAKLADFGVAVHRDATPGLTVTAAAVGTPGFMAPEQARGEPATMASDVFSLGGTLLYAATGDGPFGTSDPKVLLLRAAAGRVQRIPRTLPAPLRSRLADMLAAEPAARPTAAAARGGTAGGDLEPPTQVGVGAAPIAVHRRRRNLALALLAAIGALAIGSALVLASRDGSNADASAPSPATTPTTPTTAPCTPLPYQPCGEEPAPNTDGTACLEGFADLDGDPATGCEAPIIGPPDGALLARPIIANLVPADDVDTYRLEVVDRFQFDCGGEVHVTLTAPPSLTQRVTVLDDGEAVGTAVSGDGEPATVSIRDPNCGANDSRTLQVRVESVGSDRSSDTYRLETRGTF
jgi:serine/threonine protein kinase